MSLQVVEKEITLIEGADVSYIHVTTTVPPYLLCPSPRTNTTLTSLEASVTVGNFSGKEFCPSGKPLRQVVVGGRHLSDDGNHLLCGQFITTTLWNEGLRLPIKATVDFVKDGDVTGKISVTVSVVCSGVIEVLTSQTVQVCYYICYILNSFCLYSMHIARQVCFI